MGLEVVVDGQTRHQGRRGGGRAPRWWANHQSRRLDRARVTNTGLVELPNPDLLDGIQASRIDPIDRPSKPPGKVASTAVGAAMANAVRDATCTDAHRSVHCGTGEKYIEGTVKLRSVGRGPRSRWFDGASAKTSWRQIGSWHTQARSMPPERARHVPLPKARHSVVVAASGVGPQGNSCMGRGNGYAPCVHPFTVCIGCNSAAGESRVKLCALGSVNPRPSLPAPADTSDLRPGPDQRVPSHRLRINPRFLPECAETAGRDDKDCARCRHAPDPWRSALRDRTAGSGGEARLGHHAHPETSSSSTTPAPPPRYSPRASKPTEAACLPPMAAKPER